MTGSAVVTVLTRQGCHLCDEALGVAKRVCQGFGSELKILDVDADDELRASFSDHVPVVFVDDELLSYWFLEEEKLVAKLRDLKTEQ